MSLYRESTNKTVSSKRNKIKCRELCSQAPFAFLLQYVLRRNRFINIFTKKEVRHKPSHSENRPMPCSRTQMDWYDDDDDDVTVEHHDIVSSS